MRQTLQTRKFPRAFSLVEVLVAIAIIGMAGAALLLASDATNQAASDALAHTLAQSMAEQLLDEMHGLRYFDAPTLGSNSTNPPQTILFDEIIDFHQLELTPPLDPWGSRLGQGDGSGGLRAEDFRIPNHLLSNWSVSVTVNYVDETNPAVDLTGTSTSGLYAATVTVSRTTDGVSRPMAVLRRVFANVPAAP